MGKTAVMDGWETNSLGCETEKPVDCLCSATWFAATTSVTDSLPKKAQMEFVGAAGAAAVLVVFVVAVLALAAAAAAAVPVPTLAAVVLGLDADPDPDPDHDPDPGFDPRLIDAGAPVKLRSSISESHPYWPCPAFQDS